MDAMWNIVARVIFAAVLLCQAFGAAYFANVTNRQIRPYLDAHMEADARTALLVFIYLFLSAASASGSSVVTILSALKPAEKKPASCCHFVWTAIKVCFTLAMIAMGIITAKASWAWRRLFEINGEDYLAQQSYGLAVMMTIFLTMVAAFLLGSALVCLATFVAKRKTGAVSTANPSHNDIEGQKGAVDVIKKENSMND
ncbi:hypothetical protein SLS62_004003 [Diatrype stigma]|uniref:Uncharacterized protein n=1 Tax=Diatrype stigma TaxID=117547 RepID=A0AAN9YQT2_9PEZI